MGSTIEAKKSHIMSRPKNLKLCVQQNQGIDEFEKMKMKPDTKKFEESVLTYLLSDCYTFFNT